MPNSNPVPCKREAEVLATTPSYFDGLISGKQQQQQQQ
jgi:hypothetical protein